MNEPYGGTAPILGRWRRRFRRMRHDRNDRHEERREEEAADEPTAGPLPGVRVRAAVGRDGAAIPTAGLTEPEPERVNLRRAEEKTPRGIKIIKSDPGPRVGRERGPQGRRENRDSEDNGEKPEVPNLLHEVSLHDGRSGRLTADRARPKPGEARGGVRVLVRRQDQSKPTLRAPRRMRAAVTGNRDDHEYQRDSSSKRPSIVRRPGCPSSRMTAGGTRVTAEAAPAPAVQHPGTRADDVEALTTGHSIISAGPRGGGFQCTSPGSAMR